MVSHTLHATDIYWMCLYFCCRVSGLEEYVCIIARPSGVRHHSAGTAAGGASDGPMAPRRHCPFHRWHGPQRYVRQKTHRKELNIACFHFFWNFKYNHHTEKNIFLNSMKSYVNSVQICNDSKRYLSVYNVHICSVGQTPKEYLINVNIGLHNKV